MYSDLLNLIQEESMLLIAKKSVTIVLSRLSDAELSAYNIHLAEIDKSSSPQSPSVSNATHSESPVIQFQDDKDMQYLGTTSFQASSTTPLSSRKRRKNSSVPFAKSRSKKRLFSNSPSKAKPKMNKDDLEPKDEDKDIDKDKHEIGIENEDGDGDEEPLFKMITVTEEKKVPENKEPSGKKDDALKSGTKKIKGKKGKALVPTEDGPGQKDGRGMDSTLDFLRILRENVPASFDAKHWSSEQLANYIQETDSAEFAQIVLTEKLDGPAFLSLTLLKLREYFNVSLALAIKLCSHIDHLKRIHNILFASPLSILASPRPAPAQTVPSCSVASSVSRNASSSEFFVSADLGRHDLSFGSVPSEQFVVSKDAPLQSKSQSGQNDGSGLGTVTMTDTDTDTDPSLVGSSSTMLLTNKSSIGNELLSLPARCEGQQSQIPGILAEPHAIPDTEVAEASARDPTTDQILELEPLDLGSKRQQTSQGHCESQNSNADAQMEENIDKTTSASVGMDVDKDEDKDENAQRQDWDFAPPSASDEMGPSLHAVNMDFQSSKEANMPILGNSDPRTDIYKNKELEGGHGQGSADSQKHAWPMAEGNSQTGNTHVNGQSKRAAEFESESDSDSSSETQMRLPSESNSASSRNDTSIHSPNVSHGSPSRQAPVSLL